MGMALDAVYNHYLTTYAPRSTSQYDTHKKSELRSVYNSIVKLNKESPWFLDTDSEQVRSYAVSIKENARLLHNTIASLGGMNEEQILEQKAAYSSDESVITASFVGDAAAQDVPTLEFEVHSLATSQENRGAFLADGPVELEPDTYSFDVGINDLNYEFQFNINPGDTNRTVQERLVRLISNAGIGIHAELDEGDARASIRLTSEATGTPANGDLVFRISDDQTSKHSGAVDYFGLSLVSRLPANSSFLLNGEERSTASNSFTIGKMFEVELTGVSPEGVSTRVGLKTDTESLTDNVSTLIGSYNTFLSAASSEGSGSTGTAPLARELGAIASRYAEAFERMGIHVQSDKTISIDDDLLKESAAENGSFSPATLKGFANALMQKTNQVSLNPMGYVNRTIVAYKNPGHNFASPYVTSAYSGMLFNSYC